jgi:hypothetical protein
MNFMSIYADIYNLARGISKILIILITPIFYLDNKVLIIIKN